MFNFIKDALISFLNSSYIPNLSALIQAVTAAGVAIYGLFSFNKWAKQKYYEKRSDYADDALSYLEPAHEEIIHLLRVAKDDDWNTLYAQSVLAFKKARRKANRICDEHIDSLLKRYEKILTTIETNHIQRVDDIFSTKDKADADDNLSHSIDQLQKLYAALYEELTKKTLINAAKF